MSSEKNFSLSVKIFLTTTIDQQKNFLLHGLFMKNFHEKKF